MPPLGTPATPANTPTIHWAKCGALTIQPLNITPTGPDTRLTLNGQQVRVLNASLYPYVPNLPGWDFSNLLAKITLTYQAQNPQVVLNVSMTETTDIYSFTSLPKLLGKGGFDVMELDMLYLGFLASSGLINPAKPVGDKPFPVALAAASFGGTLWAIPSWLCMDFIYSRDPGIQQVTSEQGLKTFLKAKPSAVPLIAADFNGSWRMPSIYTNAFVQTYGYGSIAKAQTMPPDAAATNNLSDLLNFCWNVFSSANPCVNKTYHGYAPGTMEQNFALGQSASVVGFSEQSFYINLAQQGPLYVAPMPWAGSPQPLLFADGFVTNSTTCTRPSPCSADADNFVALMTSAGMKAFIVESMDLPAGSPWRTLLVATMPFYQRPEIVNNSMYNQYSKVFPIAGPFPNNYTAAIEQSMDTNICAALKVRVAGYTC
jgi:hypothetical protein